MKWAESNLYFFACSGKKKKKDAADAGEAAEVLPRRPGKKSAPVAKMLSAQIWRRVLLHVSAPLIFLVFASFSLQEATL